MTSPLVRRGLTTNGTTRRIPTQSEARFQRNVIELAGLLHWRVFHAWTSIHSPSGWPDLVMCRPPRLLFAELKSATGRITPEQQQWLDDLRACGQEAYLWRPADMPEITRTLQSREALHGG